MELGVRFSHRTPPSSLAQYSLASVRQNPPCEVATFALWWALFTDPLLGFVLCRSASLRAGLRQRGRCSFLCTRHLFLSARARLGNVAGYYRSSLAGLARCWSWQVCPFWIFDLLKAIRVLCRSPLLSVAANDTHPAHREKEHCSVSQLIRKAKRVNMSHGYL